MSIESDYLKWLKSTLAKQITAKPLVSPLAATKHWVGIGDDAAVVPTQQQTVCCTDLIAQGVHFEVSDNQSLRLAGRKALAVNISDIAVMGATPSYALLSILVNRDAGLNQAIQITEGFLELAGQYGVQLIGGDTCTSTGPIVINVTLMGEISGPPILRSRARVGDWLLATGTFGGSIHGKHLTFSPRLSEVQTIRKHVAISSLTDVTDGLARDLLSITEASGVGAILDASRIPISKDALLSMGLTSETSYADQKLEQSIRSVAGLGRALNDGEDFEALMTVSPADWEELKSLIDREVIQMPCRLTCIGQIEAQPGLRIQIDHQVFDLPAGGYDH